MIGPRINAHQIAVDTAIADAHEKYHRAAQNAGWHEKEYDRNRSEYQSEKLDEARREAAAAMSTLLEAEALYEGWSRFFLVKASNGHIHSSMHCHSTFPTTQWGWLPELSGLTEADAVAEWGGILCTFCFPSAPTDWTDGVNKKDADRKAAEAAMKLIAKTPEGKAVVGKTDLVRRHQYTVDSLQRDIDSPAREIEAAASYGRTITMADIHEGTLARAARAAERFPAAEKKLLKAKAQLADAEAALDRALEA